MAKFKNGNVKASRVHLDSDLWMKLVMNPLCLAYLRKVAQDFRHFIPTFSASNINNDVAVGILGQRLRDDRLPAPKSTWNSRGAALHAAAQRQSHGRGLENTLSFKSARGFLLPI